MHRLFNFSTFSNSYGTPDLSSAMHLWQSSLPYLPLIVPRTFRRPMSSLTKISTAQSNIKHISLSPPVITKSISGFQSLVIWGVSLGISLVLQENPLYKLDTFLRVSTYQTFFFCGCWVAVTEWGRLRYASHHDTDGMHEIGLDHWQSLVDIDSVRFLAELWNGVSMADIIG